MEREDLAAFFQASAGARGAFVGLLFVAISIGPMRTFGGPAITGALRQRLAEAALLTLVNGFVVSSIALIPGVAVGWVALVLGSGACSPPVASAGSLAGSIAMSPRPTRRGGTCFEPSA